LGLSGPVPARVPAEVKEAVLKTVDDAVAAGFAHSWACSLWQVSDSRVHRWRARRRDTGTLVDQAPGGHPVHTVLSDEVAAILQLVERWGPVDRSHRKLAHRGSYEQLVWVSPATFRRVLVAHGLTLPEPRRRCRSEKRPWPPRLPTLARPAFHGSLADHDRIGHRERAAVFAGLQIRCDTVPLFQGILSATGEHTLQGCTVPVSRHTPSVPTPRDIVWSR
jgi:transposase